MAMSTALMQIRVPARLWREGGQWCIAPTARPTSILRFDSVKDARRMASALHWRVT